MSIRLRGTLQRPTGPLFDLYERYVGEPRTRKHVYGYATFLVGYVLGLLGVAAYLAAEGGGVPDFAVRELAIATSAVGLALAMFGVGLQLPVRRRGVQASVVGLAVALASVAAFVAIYPGRWTTATDASGGVITAYTAGVAIVAGVAAMVPVATGERGWLVPEVDDALDHPPVMVGEATEGALYSLYQVGTGEWTWRVLSQEALGEKAGDSVSRPEIEESVERLRSTLADARLLEITTAAFRLYEAAAGTWRWTLMREDGGVVAESGEAYDDRSAAGEATSLLKERGPDAPLLDLDGAAFQAVEEDGRWRWRLVDEARETLAGGVATYDDRAAAEAAIEEARARFDDAPLLALEALGVELFEDDRAWRFRLVDEADETLAVATAGHDSRRAAESAAGDVLPALPEATVFAAGDPGYELYSEDGDWQFRLVDASGDVVARNHRPYPDEGAATGGADWMAATASDADVVQYEGGAFEVYEAGGEWRWRLVTEDREVVAASTEGHPDATDAQRAVAAVCDRARVADLIEFEHAAFQQYETGGRWRWRLIDADGSVMADSGEDYASREEVGDAMATLKEHAPTAEILEIESAAFELYSDDDDAWGWRLIDESGAMVAEGAARHPSRAAAREAMDFLVARSGDAEPRVMERPAFQFYTDADDGWRWRYLHPDGRTVADGSRAHATRDRLVEAVARVRETAVDAGVRTVDPLGVELAPRGGGWRFRVLDRRRSVVAESAEAHESREAAEAVVERLQAHAADAPVFAIESGAVRVVPDGEAFRWELVDGDRRVVAVGPSTYEEPGLAEVAADRASTLAADAGTVDVETAAFQVRRDDDAWGWVLVDERGSTVAAGAARHPTAAEARSAVSTLKSLLDDASVLEMDDAAFELHRGPEGWTWRLVDQNGSPLVRSVGAYPNRAAAREALDTVKAHGPDGWVSVAD